MGRFYTNGKNDYYWQMLGYLQDPNVYDTDKRVVPYTPSLLQTYADIYPSLPLGTVLFVYLNGNKAGQGQVINSDGFFAAKISVPRGDFTLTVRNIAGDILKQELYTGKNYAMILEVAAQSYMDRRVEIQQVKEDLDFTTIRSERLYPVIGIRFGFPPPPGWPVEKYRAALIGDGDGCPGFTSSFFHGGTLRGVIDTIKSITCGDVTVLPAQNGERWVVFDEAHAPNPLDASSPDAWFVSDADDIPLPNHRIFVLDQQYPYSAVRLEITDAQRTATPEDVLKGTDSFLEAPRSEDYDLDGKTLSFSIEIVGDSETKSTYATTFGADTTADQAAVRILLQNPSLTSAVYGSNGKLRIGVAPEASIVRRITIISGTALAEFGFIPGQSSDVAADTLNNPYPVGAVGLTFGATIYTDGVEFTVVQDTGEIVWVPSTSLVTNLPPRGSVLTASYDYLMKREIFDMVNKVKHTNLDIEYVFV